jgi:hypothetical protein
MIPDRALAFSWLAGTDPGTGMAPIYIAAGLIGAPANPGGYAFDAVRNVEDIIPDHDSAPKSAAEIQTDRQQRISATLNLTISPDFRK